MTDLAGKVAVVTGASRGLGQRVAIRLADRGATLVLVARGEAVLKATARSIVEKGGRAEVVSADLSDPRSLDAVVTAREPCRRTVNSRQRGWSFRPYPAHQGQRSAGMDRNIDDQHGQPLPDLPGLCGRNDRSRLGSDRQCDVGQRAASAGAASQRLWYKRAALNHFTRHLAAEVEGTGVIANVIHPGDVKTDMWADIRAKAQRVGPRAEPFLQWADWVEKTGGDDPEKAADLIIDLMGDHAASVNGQFLWIKDGLQAPIRSWSVASGSAPWQK